MTDVINNPDKPWCYSGLSSNPNITFDIVRKYPDYDWDYDFKDCRVFSGSKTLIFKKIMDEDEYVDSDYNSD